MTPVTPSSVCDMQEREAFEAAYVAEFYVELPDIKLRKRDMAGSERLGEYTRDHTQSCWIMWQARAALAERTQQEAWQPIETAPKGGCLVDILSNGRRYADCHYDRICDEFRHITACGVLICLKKATHWMPLPAEPGATRPASAANSTAPMQPNEREPMQCEDCNGTGEVGEEVYQGEFQPPERGRCDSCNGSGWWKVDAAPTQAAGGEDFECERCGLPQSQHTATHWCDNQSFAGPNGQVILGVHGDRALAAAPAAAVEPTEREKRMQDIGFISPAAAAPEGLTDERKTFVDAWDNGVIERPEHKSNSYSATAVEFAEEEAAWEAWQVRAKLITATPDAKTAEEQKPLTPEQIGDLFDQHRYSGSWFQFARTIERWHGIGDQP